MLIVLLLWRKNHKQKDWTEIWYVNRILVGLLDYVRILHISALPDCKTRTLITQNLFKEEHEKKRRNEPSQRGFAVIKEEN